MNHRTLALSLVALASATSAAHATPSANGRYVNTDGLNGRYVNTDSLNGRYVNGAAANGRYVNGRYVNGPVLGGVALQWAYVEGSKIVGWKPRYEDTDGDGHPDVVYDYVDNLEGAVLTASVVDNLGRDAGSQSLWINEQTQGTGVNSDVTYYDVSYLDGWWDTECEEPYGCWPVYRQAWQPYCPGDNKAIAVQGTWDYRQGVKGAGGKVSDSDITLACTTGAIGKCVDQLGYKPWYWQSKWVESGWYWSWWSWSWEYGPHEEWYTLGAAHEACVRMVRADYCGDGISHTDDGTGIDVGDTLANRVNALGSPHWGFEATWSEDGATCLSQARYQQYVAREGCACVDSTFDEDGTQKPFCDPSSFVYSQAQCAIQPDTLQNRSSTVPLPDSQHDGGW